MQLTGTNSSIGLIALIKQCSSNASRRNAALSARRGSGRAALSAGPHVRPRTSRFDRRKENWRESAMPSDERENAERPEFITSLPTWWLWRGGCTRSHSELGRETPQRRWYFVLRRGRVGRCQVCQGVMEKLYRDLLLPGRSTGYRFFDSPFCVEVMLALYQ
jgi:hypothetical protein